MLYAKDPGWSFGFGSGKKAKEYLLRSQTAERVKITAITDEARRKEIVVLLHKTDKKLKRR